MVEVSVEMKERPQVAQSVSMWVAATVGMTDA